MKFDDILLQIGEFGPYQQRIFYVLTLPILISGAQVLSVIFIYDIPSYRCALPNYPNDTFEIQNDVHASLVNRSIPPPADHDIGPYSGCTIYSSGFNSSGLISEPVDTSTHGAETEECHRRVYDKTDYENTVITEFDLVCGKEIMRSHANMIAFSGSLVGCLFIGIIADILGRKKAILLAIVLEIVYALVTYFAQSFDVIMGIRFIGGIATHSIFAICATTGIELVGPNKRSFVGVMVEISWILGMLLCLPIAYSLPRWRHVQLFIAIAAIPFIAFWWLVPESPRWLLDKKRYAEVENILHDVCKSNKTKMPRGAVRENNDEGPEMKIWEMFTHRVLILRSLLIFFNWFAVNLLYYGLSLNMSNLEGSPYLNYLFNALVEGVAYLFCLVVIDRVGRKKFHCANMCVGSLACFAVIPNILLGGNEWITNGLALLGKFCSSCCYTILYILSCELFPTVLRNSGIGACSVFESLGGMFAPYIADLGILVGGSLSKGIPMIGFGAITFIAGLSALLLPETRHRRLPETIQDAIEFGREDSRPRFKKTREYEMASTNEEEKKSSVLL